MQEQTEGQATIEHYTWMGEHWYRKSEVDARMDALRAVADAARDASDVLQRMAHFDELSNETIYDLQSGREGDEYNVTEWLRAALAALDKAGV